MGLHLQKSNDTASGSADKDQTARMRSPILVYTLRKINQSFRSPEWGLTAVLSSTHVFQRKPFMPYIEPTIHIYRFEPCSGKRGFNTSP